MKKGIITIGVDNKTTQEEIEEIRKNFKESDLANRYRLNILISGDDDIELSLSSFLAERLKMEYCEN